MHTREEIYTLTKGILIAHHTTHAQDESQLVAGLLVHTVLMHCNKSHNDAHFWTCTAGMKACTESF